MLSAFRNCFLDQHPIRSRAHHLCGQHKSQGSGSSLCGSPIDEDHQTPRCLTATGAHPNPKSQESLFPVKQPQPNGKDHSGVKLRRAPTRNNSQQQGPNQHELFLFPAILSILPLFCRYPYWVPKDSSPEPGNHRSEETPRTHPVARPMAPTNKM